MNGTRESERAAAMAWTRIAEGEDVQATKLIAQMGYEGALDWVRRVKEGESVKGSTDPAADRWARRYDVAAFERDREAGERFGGFVMPEDPVWPEALFGLDTKCPVGLWYRGSIGCLHKVAMAIVGTRDPSAYGTRIATDFAYDLAKMGVPIISGGAFGIDAAAHMGALAAGGQTIAVMAGGVDRPYPATNLAIFDKMLETGGLLLSEAPPGASPHRHRFLSRNRIIAGLAKATIVVEAPLRSGAINTARHAQDCGRQVGAVPGPVTSARSAGCHRLLREDATCVAQVTEAVELLGFRAVTGGVQTRLDIPEIMNDDEVPAAPAAPRHTLNPLALRVRDALPVVRPATPQKLAATAGLSMKETVRGLGFLEMDGVAESVDGKWRLNKKAS